MTSAVTVRKRNRQSTHTGSTVHTEARVKLFCFSNPPAEPLRIAWDGGYFFAPPGPAARAPNRPPGAEGQSSRSFLQLGCRFKVFSGCRVFSGVLYGDTTFGPRDFKRGSVVQSTPLLHLITPHARSHFQEVQKSCSKHSAHSHLTPYA